MELVTKTTYFEFLISENRKYLEYVFSKEELTGFYSRIIDIKNIEDKNEVIKKYTQEYIRFIKTKRQHEYQTDNNEVNDFISNNKENKSIKIIWGNCLNVLQKLNSESVNLIVTSPPYYNAREYSQWENLNLYLEEIKNIIKECYRVLENHRVFVFNIGDVFGNDNLKTKSSYGKRRLPLSAYFIKIFEELDFTFVDDFIWDKGEVQSERHKNKGNPYPFYQYPMNCYEHLLIFHKHKIDDMRYPCPVCGSLNVNNNSKSEIGIQSWECKNLECFNRSVSNRGKRFSLKTIMTQGNKTTDGFINEEIVKKWRRDIIKINPVIKINNKGENTLGHTAPFPNDIPEMAVRFFSYPNDIVLDPFAGSFTTPIMASNLNRTGVGIELNKNMFRDSAIKNITAKTNNTSVDEIDL